MIFALSKKESWTYMCSFPSNAGKTFEKSAGWSGGELEMGSVEIQISEAQEQGVW